MTNNVVGNSGWACIRSTLVRQRFRCKCFFTARLFGFGVFFQFYLHCEKSEKREKRVVIMMQMRVFHARLVVSVWCMFSLPKPLWRITMEEKKLIVDGLAAWMEGRIKTWRGLGRGWTEMLAGFEIKENNTQCQWKFSPTNFKSSASLNFLLITCIFGQICESLVNKIRLRTL